MNAEQVTFDFIKGVVSKPGLSSEGWKIGGAARFTDPPTSKKAAAGISGRTEARILEVFAETFGVSQRGLIDDELVALMPLFLRETVKSARSRLSKAGLLVSNGDVRPSNRGRDSLVWRRA